MVRNSIWKPIIVATLVCGTLDIVYAMILTLLRGKQIGNMLRFVASGPFPDAVQSGAAGALLGLAVHYTLMAIMVAVFVIAARQVRHILDIPLRAGITYGVISWAVMNLVVVPLRFHTPFPPPALSIALQLFAHIALVGLPTAYISRRYLRARR